MSDFKLEYTLKQHTPIIHFQSDQKGATLRATELKPKLDRFLIDKLQLTQIVKKNNKDIELPKDQYKSLFINEGDLHLALNYKVNIQAIGVKQHSIDLQKKNHDGSLKFKMSNGEPALNRNGEQVPTMNPFPTFFATMGESWENDKKYFNHSLRVILTIKVLDPVLRGYIKSNMASFLAYTNFGTRQSKGFGSFYLDKEDKNNYVDIHRVYKYEKCWSFDISINEKMKDKVANYYPLYGESYSLFSKIELLYKILRSGINTKNMNNETVFYFKSLLYQYMQKNDNYDVWDKAVIKSKFLDKIDISDKRVLSRDLLGLSTIHEYRRNELTGESKFTVRHPNPNKTSDAQYTVNDVERFKSPIIFKPIKLDKNTFRIYITHRPLNVYKDLIKKEILILQEKNRRIENNVKIKLLEQEEDFNLADFLDSAFLTNIESHILKYQKDTDSNYLDYKEDKKDKIALSKSIEIIFNSIKEVS